ncbi:MAG: hypothetical protein DHS80DRAFT_21688 [Piptocephalis tieghemiana]|nr:MAG: hypothetical protein DHS80DRAFT_21688 [Piptocephalis tieghemiana]
MRASFATSLIFLPLYLALITRDLNPEARVISLEKRSGFSESTTSLLPHRRGSTSSQHSLSDTDSQSSRNYRHRGNRRENALLDQPLPRGHDILLKTMGPASPKDAPLRYPINALSRMGQKVQKGEDIAMDMGKVLGLDPDGLPGWCTELNRFLDKPYASYPWRGSAEGFRWTIFHARLCNYLSKGDKGLSPEDKFSFQMDIAYASSLLKINHALDLPEYFPGSMGKPHQMPDKKLNRMADILTDIDNRMYSPLLFLESRKRTWIYKAKLLEKTNDYRLPFSRFEPWNSLVSRHQKVMDELVSLSKALRDLDKTPSHHEKAPSPFVKNPKSSLDLVQNWYSHWELSLKYLEELIRSLVSSSPDEKADRLESWTSQAFEEIRHKGKKMFNSFLSKHEASLKSSSLGFFSRKDKLPEEAQPLRFHLIVLSASLSDVLLVRLNPFSHGPPSHLNRGFEDFDSNKKEITYKRIVTLLTQPPKPTPDHPKAKGVETIDPTHSLDPTASEFMRMITGEATLVTTTDERYYGRAQDKLYKLGNKLMLDFAKQFPLSLRPLSALHTAHLVGVNNLIKLLPRPHSEDTSPSLSDENVAWLRSTVEQTIALNELAKIYSSDDVKQMQKFLTNLKQVGYQYASTKHGVTFIKDFFQMFRSKLNPSKKVDDAIGIIGSSGVSWISGAPFESESESE